MTVTFWGTFQLALVNVMLPCETVPSLTLPEKTITVTLSVGWLSSTMVNSAAPPASVVTRPDVGATVIPAVSLSMFVIATPGWLTAAYFASLVVTGPTAIV